MTPCSSKNFNPTLGFRLKAAAPSRRTCLFVLAEATSEAEGPSCVQENIELVPFSSIRLIVANSIWFWRLDCNEEGISTRVFQKFEKDIGA